MYAYTCMRVRVGGRLGRDVWKGGGVTMRVSASFRRCRSRFESLSLSLSLSLPLEGLVYVRAADQLSQVCVCVCVCVLV
jgi:hypothetical protein